MRNAMTELSNLKKKHDLENDHYYGRWLSDTKKRRVQYFPCKTFVDESPRDSQGFKPSMYEPRGNKGPYTEVL